MRLYQQVKCVIFVRALADEALSLPCRETSCINKSEYHQCFHKLSTKTREKWCILESLKTRETDFFFFNFCVLKEEREIIRTTTSKYIEAKKCFILNMYICKAVKVQSKFSHQK